MDFKLKMAVVPFRSLRTNCLRALPYLYLTWVWCLLHLKVLPGNPVPLSLGRLPVRDTLIIVRRWAFTPRSRGVSPFDTYSIPPLRDWCNRQIAQSFALEFVQPADLILKAERLRDFGTRPLRQKKITPKGFCSRSVPKWLTRTLSQKSASSALSSSRSAQM